MKITKLARNDTQAALDYCRERDWTITPEAAEMLLMLQDDSTELRLAMARMAVTVREREEGQE